jgi:hypothetical protein
MGPRDKPEDDEAFGLEKLMMESHQRHVPPKRRPFKHPGKSNDRLAA